MCVILTKGNKAFRAIFALIVSTWHAIQVLILPATRSFMAKGAWLSYPGALSSAKESCLPCPRFGASLCTAAICAWLLPSEGCIHLAPTWNHICSSSAPPESRLSQHGSWVLPSCFFHSSPWALFLRVHPPISEFQHLFSREFDAGHTHLFKDVGNCDAI